METLHVSQCRTKSSLRSLQPVLGTSTPHVQGEWDPETCLGLEEGEGDPDLGSSLGSVNNLLCEPEQDICFLPGSVSSNYKMNTGSLLDS